MTERDIPDSWSGARAREPDQNTRLSRTQQFGETQPVDVSGTGSSSESVKRGKKNNSVGKGKDSHSSETTQVSKSSWKLPRWMRSWIFWSLLLTLIPGSVAFLATAMLLKLPAAPNCPSIFWPLASASVRLHCAQLAASKQTVNDLLQAIALVNELPDNHPLHAEINRFTEEWSRDILQLADASFQSGNLEEAIATARKIPQELAAYKLVDEQIDKWQTTWSKAESIYNNAITEVRERRWQSAFMLSARMLRIDNQYWASTKYDQLNKLIATAREDGDKLGKAEILARSQVVDNLLEAIKLAESIGQESYLYQKAQEAIPAFGRKMLELAQAKLDKQDADEALDIARQIPESAKLQAETDDFIAIADAKRSAWLGNVSGLEAAIAQAQQIDPSRPIYEEAQQLIARWQLEIEDVAHLEKARVLASQGTVNNLTAAIAQVQLIPASNPRGTEAREEMSRWRAQVETIEDQPYLERAEQIAIFDDINSLQAAIAQASQIRRGRALYPEARRKIRTWIGKIQRIEDQPYLDQARELALSGNLPAAITAAQQIASSGRALAGEAQSAVDDWQGQIRTKENWRQAQQIAVAGTPEALAEAIRLADRVSNNSILRMDANLGIDQWSQQLLDIARTQAQSDISRGIEIAKSIPRGSAAYNAAQDQIRSWQEFLNPPRPEPSPPLESPQSSPSTTTISQ
ncbi:chromosome segregation ATPase [Nostoc linckia z18]|uniref:Chromosome segregation ATPase n=2 Tax=Nostoc linckia TaxID=92942 RepID=A0A9Q6ENI1_NOSLI|nr:chromosome segregation ATPase [Nostoc linckia]PHK33320.1 chromosome segregation ATPase [Nostoc linckia z15]PHK45269.1 chromosome segregation ATPase [Nostoc linckia z16]PHJ67912.1 chromosome segregation ATPase [Nostoc linckia z1]PHJ72851.1 chromosome segregation ATPase [Nostoc linckia z3]PHJ77493.1 chromosome segregation ATPase [Nostoc linckia z2]